MADNLFSRTGVQYEVALDVIGAVIAHYSEVVGIEREKSDPDNTLITAALAAKDQLREVRDNLNPVDQDSIDAVLAKYGELARSLYK